MTVSLCLPGASIFLLEVHKIKNITGSNSAPEVLKKGNKSGIASMRSFFLPSYISLVASTAVLQLFWSCCFFPGSNFPFRPNALCLRTADLVYVNVWKHALLKKCHCTQLFLTGVQKETSLIWEMLGTARGRASQYCQDEEQRQQIKLARSTSPFEAFVSSVSMSCSHLLQHINSRKQNRKQKTLFIFKNIKWVWYMKNS